MKKMILLALLTLLLVGCGTSESSVQATITETVRITTTNTPESTETPTEIPTEAPTLDFDSKRGTVQAKASQTALAAPTSTPRPSYTPGPSMTPYPTLTPYKTKTPRPSNVPPSELPAMSMMLLTADEMNAFTDIWETTPKSVDNFAEYCKDDCADKEWITIDRSMTLFIGLDKYPGSLESDDYVAWLKGRNEDDPEYKAVDVPQYDESPLPENTFLFKRGKSSYTMAASQGRVVVTVMCFFDETVSKEEVRRLMSGYMHLQAQKLEDYGYKY